MRNQRLGDCEFASPRRSGEGESKAIHLKNALCLGSGRLVDGPTKEMQRSLKCQ